MVNVKEKAMATKKSKKSKKSTVTMFVGDLVMTKKMWGVPPRLAYVVKVADGTAYLEPYHAGQNLAFTAWWKPREISRVVRRSKLWK